MLNKMGFLNSSSGLNTPVFGIATKQAIEEFQLANGLVPNGRIDEKTWNKLFE